MTNNKIKGFLLITLVVCSVLYLFHPDLAPYRDLRYVSIKLSSIRTYWWAPYLFILTYVLGCIIAIPGSILTLSAGAVFGFWEGFLYTFIASNIGAVVAFMIGRYLGKGFLSNVITKISGLKHFDEKATANGFIYILRLRLFPVAPFNAINFGAGVSSIKMKDFVWASLIGMIPGTAIYVYFAASIVSGVEGASEHATWNFVIACVLLLGVSFLPGLFVREK